MCAVRRCQMALARYPTTTIAHSTQPRTGFRFFVAMARIALFVTAIVPPSFATINTTPCHERKKASVTTNEGMPTLATSQPVRRPIATPISTDPGSRSRG